MYRKKTYNCNISSSNKKCCEIINSKPFFGLLTDGSQAHKTGDDKEMVLLKLIIKVCNIFFMKAKTQFIQAKYSFGPV